jgi:hypothetical protein
MIAVAYAVWVMVAQAQAGFAGKWQGETGSGGLVLLDLKVKG